MVTWAHDCGIQLRLNEPGTPNQNAYADSFNGRLRDERLNQDLFTNLFHARTMVETWRREYNEERPKKALSGLTPAAYAKQLSESAAVNRTPDQTATESGGRRYGQRKQLTSTALPAPSLTETLHGECASACRHARHRRSQLRQSIGPSISC